jgi:hypothetical protein
VYDYVCLVQNVTNRFLYNLPLRTRTQIERLRMALRLSEARQGLDSFAEEGSQHNNEKWLKQMLSEAEAKITDFQGDKVRGLC